MAIVLVIQNFKWIARLIYPMHYKDKIEIYAREYNVDPHLVVAIMRNESKFNPNALSRKEAKGLMQIAPITGDWASQQLNLTNYTEEMLYDPDLNIKIGCWYLNILHNEFDNQLELIIAAYNAGNGNVSKWLQDSRYSNDGKVLKEIPFNETKTYLEKVLRDYKIYKVLYGNKGGKWHDIWTLMSLI
jgi:soluble lytic murein transglycosylase